MIKVVPLVLPVISSYSVENFSGSTDWPHLRGLKLADPKFLAPGKIDMLLGIQIHARIVRGSVIKGPNSEPISTDTELGWVI